MPNPLSNSQVVFAQGAIPRDKLTAKQNTFNAFFNQYCSAPSRTPLGSLVEGQPGETEFTRCQELASARDGIVEDTIFGGGQISARSGTI